MHVQARLEAWFALLVKNLERAVGVAGRDLAGRDIGARIDIALAGG
jgi:hypothetical protein